MSRRRGRALSLRASVVVGAALACVACSRFDASDSPVGAVDGGTGSADGTTPVDGGAGSPDDASSAGPVFVDSRTTILSAPPLTVLSPAGIRPGDVLVAAWGAGDTESKLPADWAELGRSFAGDCCGGVFVLIVAYHLVGPTENESTTFAFQTRSGTHQISLIAYRNARSSQPVSPVTVSTLPTTNDAGMTALDIPPFDTHGVSVPLFFLHIVGATTFPIVAGFDRAEATTSLAIYRARAAVPDGVSVPQFHVEFPTPGPATNVMVGALAVVSAP